MSSTAFNLLLAFLLLAANAFYVAAEFALVKSRGFRIKAMVEQDRFGARLLQGMMGNIEAYLACCQLGITMASLGLGWVGEPTVSALLEPVLIPLGMSERTLHFVSFMAGFLVFSSLHIVIGEQVPKTLAIRQPMPVSQWIAYPLHRLLPGVLSAELAAQHRLARDSAPARRQGILAARNPHRLRDRRAGGGIRRAWRHRKRRGRIHPQRLPLRRSRRLRRHGPPHRDDADQCRPAAGRTGARGAGDRIHPHPAVARQAGKHHRRAARQGSAARDPRLRGRHVARSTSPPSCCRPGSCRRCGRCPNS